MVRSDIKFTYEDPGVKSRLVMAEPHTHDE